jgi:hypothetical protein
MAETKTFKVVLSVTVPASDGMDCDDIKLQLLDCFETTPIGRVRIKSVKEKPKAAQ